MKSYLKTIFGMTAGSFCFMVLAQVSIAQSGSRSNAYQLPQTTQTQRFQAPAAQGNYGAQQGSGQRSQAPTYETQSRQTFGVGFEQYDHRGLDSLLQKYVDRNGDVDYVTWQANRQDRATLLNYLRGMNAVDTSISSSRQSEMAFWINAYNAMTIEGILQLYPTKSIKDHAPDPNGFNIWDDFKLPVAGTEYSLNDIEHKVLRKMGDPRIHFAIVCASKSCPQLSQRAYFAESLEQQLAHGAGLFFHTPSKFSYDLQRGQLGLSPIIDWFGEDFGRNDQERLQYLAQFMPADAGRLAASGSATINYLDYDWGLNVAPQGSALGQNLVTVEALRPQGSATRQPVPTENFSPQGSGTRQLSPSQNLSSQGSGTRQPIDAYRPRQQPRRCGQGRCSSQAGYDYGAIGQ